MNQAPPFWPRVLIIRDLTKGVIKAKSGRVATFDVHFKMYGKRFNQIPADVVPASHALSVF